MNAIQSAVNPDFPDLQRETGALEYALVGIVQQQSAHTDHCTGETPALGLR